MQQIKTTEDLLKKIALEMKIKGYLHKDLAEYLGLSRSRVSFLLSGKSTPSTEILLEICYYLKINVYVD
jgi:transcriptional regulator with XRE-family HTH domain